MAEDSVPKDRLIRTHELTILDPETRKCRKITPSGPNQVFVVKLVGIQNGKPEKGIKVPVETPDEIGVKHTNLAGYPL